MFLAHITWTIPAPIVGYVPPSLPASSHAMTTTAIPTSSINLPHPLSRRGQRRLDKVALPIPSDSMQRNTFHKAIPPSDGFPGRDSPFAEWQYTPFFSIPILKLVFGSDPRIAATGKFPSHSGTKPAIQRGQFASH